MKKVYINPAIEAEHVKTNEMICASNLSIGGTETDGTANSKGSQEDELDLEFFDVEF